MANENEHRKTNIFHGIIGIFLLFYKILIISNDQIVNTTHKNVIISNLLDHIY